MRRSELFVSTSKKLENEEISKGLELAMRSGLIHQSGSGLYSYTPLGYRVLDNISKLVRYEMNSIGSQEILVPSLQPRGIWEETGRWKLYEGTMFSLRDRNSNEYCLSPTAEEAVTDMVRSSVKSYRNLPVLLYQISAKYRNESVRQGIMRTKEFWMKDAYSFNLNEQDLDESYSKIRKAYKKIFDNIGLNYVIKSASTDEMGGKISEEFIALTDVGSDRILACDNQDCHFGSEISSNVEKCDNCGSSIKETIGSEIGHIFKLGERYTRSMNARYIDELGKERTIQMGCYGIGLSRLVSVIIEQNNDDKGIHWPEAVAPYKEVIIPTTHLDESIIKIAQSIYEEMRTRKLDPLFDDRRDVRAGEKFVESDLMGIPRKIIVGPKNIKQGKIEVEDRTGKKQFFDVGNFVTDYSKKLYHI